MASERPCPVLIETGKSYPKTGLFPAVSGGSPLDYGCSIMYARRKRDCANRKIAFHEALYDGRVYTIMGLTLRQLPWWYNQSLCNITRVYVI